MTWFAVCGWAGEVVLQRRVGKGLRGLNSFVVIADGIVWEVRRLFGVVVASGALLGRVCCAFAVPAAVVVQPLSVLRRICCRNS